MVPPSPSAICAEVILRALCAHGTPKDALLLYHLERIHGFVEAVPCLQFIPALSESWPDDWSGERGMITDAVARRLASLRNFDAYLCGPPAMIDPAIPLLIERGVRHQKRVSAHGDRMSSDLFLLQ